MFDSKEYIYAVYREQSFSKAAKKLYITQPCLSAMVIKTEKRLGLPIFNRNTKPIQLTECGKKYIECAERIMLLEQQFDSYLNDARGLKAGHISIGANNVCSSFVLPQHIKRFTDCYPEIDIELHEGNVHYLDEQLQNGSLDVILDNYPVDEKLYETQRLCTERLLIAVPTALLKQDIPAARVLLAQGGFEAKDIVSGKHLKDDAPALSMSDFASLPFIVLRKGNDTRKRFEQLCQESRIEPEIALEVDQLSTAYNIAGSNIGAALISDTLITNMPFAGSLRFYKISSGLMQRDLFFHLPKNKYASLALRKFMEQTAAFYSGENARAAL